LAGEIHGTVAYPGILAPESATMTISHGITPGVCVIRCSPQDVLPAQVGTLVFTDGNETIALPDCRVNQIRWEQDDAGWCWSVEIVDRRWKWRELGAMLGAYNQLDPFGKLLPFTIRAPDELAALCFQAMGEDNYTLNLPPGIAYPGPFVSQPIVNISGVNPPINWNGIPPAQALQQVADMCGCRVVYQWKTNSVLVAPPGAGALLPPGSISRLGPTLKSPETPDSIAIMGAPTRYQVRIPLRAVGKEWDGSYRPIDRLSYAPRVAATPQKVNFTIAFDGVTASITYEIFLGFAQGADPATGATFTKGSSAGDTGATIALALAALINASADPRVRGVVMASAAGSVLSLTAVREGVPFTYASALSGILPRPAGNSITTSITAAAPGGVSWGSCPPPLFATVRATDRLTYAEAVRLAQESVWRCYQVILSKNFLQPALLVPGYGDVERMQQLVLEETQVDQITPQPGDENLIDPLTHQLATVNFYNGYSRDKPAAVYGSVAEGVNTTIHYKNKKINRDEEDQVFVPFSTDPVRYMIVFNSYVYRLDEGFISEPDLTLQTAVQVRDFTTNQVESFLQFLVLPGFQTNTNPRVYQHPDVQLNVTSVYENGELKSWNVLESDPQIRANFYLQSHLKEYLATSGQTVEYNGFRAIDLDGAVQQVTWSLGPDGCSTTASRNTEHSLWVPPYPARRRVEFLDPVRRVDMEPRHRIDMPGGGGT